MREKFTCRDCEKISQPPAPFHVIARGWAGPSLLAMILFEKYGQHQPLNRQAERYAREGVRARACRPWPIRSAPAARRWRRCIELIERHVLAAERLHGDDTTVPVLAKGKTDTGRCWTYVRDDRPFGGAGAAGRAVLLLARSRRRASRRQHLAGYAGILQADAYGGSASSTRPTARPGRSPRRPAGPMPGASSSSWPMSQPTPAARRRQNRRPDLADRTGGGPPHRRAVRHRARDQRPAAPSGGRAVRQELSAPLVAELEAWMRERAAQAVAPATTSPRPSTTCSSAGRPSPASSTTAGSASRTTPPNARCAASPSAESHGCSPAPIAAASAPRPSTP